MISLIVACSQDYGIGYKGTLPWHYKEDLQFFKAMTLGRVCVCGHTTIKKMPELKNRTVACLSRKNGLCVHDAIEILTSDIETYVGTILTNKQRSIRSQVGMKENENFVIGGAETYKTFLTLDVVDKIYMTMLNTVCACDSYFPIEEVNNKKWDKQVINFSDLFDIESKLQLHVLTRVR